MASRFDQEATVASKLMNFTNWAIMIPTGQRDFQAMKLHYDPETDSLYIELTDAPGAQEREIAEGLVIQTNL